MNSSVKLLPIRVKKSPGGNRKPSCFRRGDNDYMTGETTYRYYNEEIWPDVFADCVPFEEALDMLGK